MAFVPERRSSRQPLINAPSIVLGLIAALVVCHVIRIALPGGLPDLVLLRYSFIPARYAEAIANAAVQGGVAALIVPLFAYMLLHADFTHLGVNCLWLLVFGPVVARRLRTPRFLVFFVFCGVAA